MSDTYSQKWWGTLGGVTMIASMVVAMMLANTSDWYHDFVTMPIVVKSPFFFFELTPKLFAKNWLLVPFFAYIGMELRYEFEEGFLANKKQLVLPLVGAFGGMAIPGLLFCAINIRHPENFIGFAIPTATDIAFALALFNIIAFKLPATVRMVLMSIAIIDDILAIIIIALFYSHDFQFIPMVMSGLLFIGLLYCRFVKLAEPLVYISLGVLMCLTFAGAGLHTTLAGFVVGFFLPMTSRGGNDFLKEIKRKFHFYIYFLILPLFAFVASGVDLRHADSILWYHPLVLGTTVALCFGNSLGISGLSYLSLRAKWTTLPQGVEFMHVVILSFFAGVGFTMSLFFAMLAFPDCQKLELAKVGVLAGSSLSVIIASALVLYQTGWVFRRRRR